MRAPHGHSPYGTRWLDELSTVDSRRRLTEEAWLSRGVVVLGVLIAAGFLVLIMVGVTPLNPKDQAGIETARTSAMRQVFFLGLFALSLPIFVVRWRLALEVVVRLWPLFIVLAVLAATTLWSVYPDVTLRRLIVMIISTVVAIAIAVSLNTPRHFLLATGAVCAAIVVGDLMAAALVPERAFTVSPDGLRGLHASKNTAGAVLLAIIPILCGAAIAARSLLGRTAMVGALLLALVVLALTLSKTSLGLTAVGLGVILPAYLIARLLPGTRPILALLAAITLGVTIVMSGALSLSASDWAELITGDRTLTDRTEIWAAIQRHIAERPLLGYGYGAQWSLMPKVHPLAAYPGFWTVQDFDISILRQSHNGYLDLMVHGGVLLASAAALFLTIVIGKIIVSIWQPIADRGVLALDATFALFVPLLMVSNMLESSLFFQDAALGQVLILLLAARAAARSPTR